MQTRQFANPKRPAELGVAGGDPRSVSPDAIPGNGG
jgi:hypothetical protein